MDKKNNEKSKKNQLITKDFSPKEVNLIEESFNLVKSLNTEIDNIKISKENLQRDIKTLEKRISKKSGFKEHVAEHNNNLILTLKEEISKEFMPLFNKLNLKSIKVDVFDDIKKILEIEVRKLKSESDFKLEKNKKDFTKKLSDIEIRIIESLNQNKKLSKEIENLKDNEIKSIYDQFVIKLNKVMNNVNNNSNSNDLTKIKKDLETNTKILDEFEKKLSDLNNLQNKDTKEKISTLTDEINFIKNIIAGMKTDFDKIKTLNESSIDKKITKDVEKIQNVLNQTLKNNEKNSFQLENHKKDFEQTLKKIEIEKKAQNNFFLTKFNENVTKTNDIIEDAKSIVSQKVNELKNNVESKFLTFSKEARTQIAREIASNNEFRTSISNESKENIKRVNEEIEIKFLSSKEQYKAMFKDQLSLFEGRLNEKEKEYFEKLNIIEEDKNQMLLELETFKKDITILTKEYIQKLDEEFQNIKGLEGNFNKEKTSFLMDVDEILRQKKIEILGYSDELKTDLQNLLVLEKEKSDENENTFKQTFNEKITNLHEFTKDKIEKVEKKFVEKNLKIVMDKIGEEMKIIELYNQTIKSKEDEINKKVDYINEKEEMFFSEAAIEKQKLKEDIEQRLTTLSQNFNKRFIDYESDISSFKAVVIDEVEDLLKEIRKLMDDKIKEVENVYGDFEKERNLAKTQYENFENTAKNLKLELREVRDDINDVRVKLELITDVNTFGMNEHITYMVQYEKQLLELIESLKKSQMPLENIQRVLIKKGHPQFYVNLILKNYEKILN